MKVTVPVTVQPAVRWPAPPATHADVRQRSTAVTPAATLLVGVPSAVVVVMVLVTVPSWRQHVGEGETPRCCPPPCCWC